jgi:S-formylglutathione hydrolase FrmB
MGIMRYNYRSDYMMNVDVTIVVPSLNITTDDPTKKGWNPADKGKKFPFVPGMKFQTVYFLHGGGDDDTLPYRYTSLERYAEENNVMLVTPRVVDTFYADAAHGWQAFKFMTEELPSVIQSYFPSAPERENNFVVGFAMGGNGALGLWQRRPDLYAACVDLSGGIGYTLDTNGLQEQIAGMKRMEKVFGDPAKIPGSDMDMYAVAKRNLENKVDMPEFFLASGAEDFIVNRVRKDRDLLTELGYKFTYAEEPGLGHEWAFWDKYFAKALNEWLPLKRRPIYPGD